MCISDGHCIESYKFCNGVVDCYDGSDEDRCTDDSGVFFIAYGPLTFNQLIIIIMFAYVKN